MSADRIARSRMGNQRLWGKPFDTPEEVVGWLGALQAQEFPYAKWSVAQRANGVDHQAMARAFDEGTILRSHFLRPTWHFALARDIRWLLTATAPRVRALNASSNRQHGIDEELAARTNAVLGKALGNGEHLTRKELAAILERAGIVASGPRLAYIIMRAELDAIVVSGAKRGRQHTYALLEERAPNAITLDHDEALAELTRRYFTSRGPATLKDYSRWSSLTAAECKRGVEMIKSGLEHEEIDGRTYWFGSSSVMRKEPRPRVDLVQGFDEIIMSYSESRHVVAPVTPGLLVKDRRIFHNAILLDGRLIGLWRHDPPKGSVAVETILHRPLEPAEIRALDAAVQRYGRFLGVAASLR
ncbi:MAG: winged helix DNA-binding domain-containing protein [Actinomycetota bacterium]